MCQVDSRWRRSARRTSTTSRRSSAEAAEPIADESFTFGEFFGGIFGFFAFLGMIFLLIGSAEAYKIASADVG